MDAKNQSGTIVTGFIPNNCMTNFKLAKFSANCVKFGKSMITVQ